MKKGLNILLFLTFVITLLVPVTGIIVHKMGAVLFLLLCIVHTILHWKEMNARRFLVLGLITAAFLTGLFGMIFEQYAVIASVHTVVSIMVVFFLAIHIYVFRARLSCKQNKGRKSYKKTVRLQH